MRRYTESRVSFLVFRVARPLIDYVVCTYLFGVRLVGLDDVTLPPRDTVASTRLAILLRPKQT